MIIKAVRPARIDNEREAILVTDGGVGQGRSALAAVRALAAAGYVAVVGTTGPRNLAAASRFCSGSVATPVVSDPGYADSIRQSAQTLGARILPASDAALVALGRPEAAFVDKAALEARCAAVEGLCVPPSAVVTDATGLADAATAFGYPVIVKPSISTRPARIVRDETEVAESAIPLSSGAPAVVQPFLDEPLDAVSGVMHGGRLVGVVHQRALRTWPVSCGPSCAAVTVERDLARERQLAALMAEHEGLFQAQFLGPFLIDLNPRVYGSLALAVAAGVNLLALSLDPPARDAQVLVGRSGVHYRWLEGDLRHLVSRRNELGFARMVSALRPRRGTAHSVVSSTDLGPLVARLRYARSRR